MIQKYPISIQDFEKLRSENFVYVDKTQFAFQLADIGGSYFLSRPRRFGKSLFLSTLACIFEGKKELFENTFVYDKWDWEQRFPIIRISFSNIGHQELGLEQAIRKRLLNIYSEHELEAESHSISQLFKELITLLHKKYNQKVAVLIDEYDKPIIDHLSDEEIPIAVANQKTLKIFYSILKDADPHLKLVFITGVSKFTQVSIFSDLNNLFDMTLSSRFGGVCGITQQELKDYFPQELSIHNQDEIKNWYNGYTWDMKTYVYNPFSLLNFFIEGRFENFWFETGTPTFLVEMAKKEKSYDLENIKATKNELKSFDINELKSLTILFQTGYITFKEQDSISGVYTLSYPNKEVKQSYLEALANVFTSNRTDNAKIIASEIRTCLVNDKPEKLKNIINSLFKSVPYDHWQKENEHFYHAILHLTFKMMGIYTLSEVHSSNGRMDALVQLDNAIYAFEFKLDKTAEIAIQQIKDKGYLEPFRNENKPLIAIGVNFSTEMKAVEEILVEEV